jgi:phosphoribosyl-ATP pyrophosphohydrolase/phosphoribosyl-AMP cyclohydrolase
MLTEQLDWEKTDGMMPAIVQHAISGEVLMLGYMNQDALAKTEESGKVTFYSRTKQRLWTKGETSGNFLNVVSITPDCDNDTLLVLVNPIGPTCHKGTSSCFGDAGHQWLFLYQLEQLLAERKHADRKAPIPRSCMPAVPSVLRKKWVKKAWRPRWPQRCMTSSN